MIYEPREDSYLVKENIKKHVKNGDSVLDMGTGSGILANESINYTDKVTAVDINKKTLQYAKENSHQDINFIHSDLFENLNENYDVIIFNPPYLPEDKAEDLNSREITTGGKKGYEVIEKFLEQAPKHLNDDGKVLLLFSSATNKDMVEEFISRNLLKFKQVARKSLPMFEILYLYRIEKTELLKSLKDVKELAYLTKGNRGYIYTGKLKNQKVAIKLRNPKSKAVGRIKNESDTLKLLNKHNIGPKLIKSNKDYFMYNFVDGEFIFEYVKFHSKEEIQKVIKLIFLQLHKLDKLQFNKEEMHRPFKHILIKGTKPVMLDFERTNKTEKPHNVTQFSQYICSIKPELKKKGIFVNITKIRDLSRQYKKSYDKKVLDQMIKTL